VLPVTKLHTCPSETILPHGKELVEKKKKCVSEYTVQQAELMCLGGTTKLRLSWFCEDDLDSMALVFLCTMSSTDFSTL